LLLTKYYLGDQIKEDEMESVDDTWGRREMHTGFWWGKLKKRGHLKDIGVGGMIILKLS
jgi:hypothetical protein